MLCDACCVPTLMELLVAHIGAPEPAPSTRLVSERCVRNGMRVWGCRGVRARCCAA